MKAKTERLDIENQPQLVKACSAPPSAVVSFAAPIEAGKTTLSTRLGLQLGAPRVSFGDYLRELARKSVKEVTREVLQELGDRLVNQDVGAFCEEVLKQQPWQPRRPLIIDGVRHVEVLDALVGILAPAKVYLIFINVDRMTQSKRFEQDPLPHEKRLDELEQHPTELQVRSKLLDRAGLVLDGTEDPDKSMQKIIEFLASEGGDRN